MPHFPKPFFRASRGLWYVQVAGHQHNLGPDEAEAFRRYHALMADPPAPKRKLETKPAPADSLLAVLEKFLDWCQEHRSADTFEWYRWRLQLFADAVDKRLTVERLKPFHLDDWLARHPRWSSGTKHGMCRAVMRALRWAEKRGRIEKSPLAHYEKPRAGRRKVVVPPAEFERLLAFVRNARFRDLLLVTWETAARPQETLAVEARHVDLAHGRWVFPPDESKGEQWPRVVYLTDVALGITRRLMLEFPTGPLFRNTAGRPWTTDAVNCCFGALRQRLGRAELKRLGLAPSGEDVTALAPTLKAERTVKGRRVPKTAAERLREARRKLTNRLAARHAPKYCLYHLRHSWLDRALKRGVDALTCAILMGHRDPSTVSRVYQHLAQSPDFLRGQAKRAAG